MVGPGDAGQPRRLRGDRSSPDPVALARPAPRDDLPPRRPAHQGTEGPADDADLPAGSPRSWASSSSAPRRSARTRSGPPRSGILEPHQQMVVVLSKAANDQYSTDGRNSDRPCRRLGPEGRPDPDGQTALLSDGPPAGAGQAAALAPPADLVADQPRDLGRPAPESMGVGQQQAMLDWLHWGGQLVIVGGAGPAFAPLRESFLAPYLPAEPSGENVMRTGRRAEGAVRSLSGRPAAARRPRGPDALQRRTWDEAWESFGRRYKPPAPIPAPRRSPCSSPGSPPSQARPRSRWGARTTRPWASSGRSAGAGS